jgi:hypothetical protein
MSEAAFTALRRLETLCLEEHAAFLILAGDVYNEEDGILRARLALRDMFLRLEKAGVEVFLAHGNHDPLESGAPVVRWPGNVTVFGPEVEERAVTRQGAALALVSGISHAQRGEKGNLALRFGQPQGSLLGPGLFRVGVLHCAVGGNSDGHAPYAPCALADLGRGGFDYWALGHVHTPRVLAKAPWVAYPGSLQGLHVNESGPHGCFLVRVGRDGSCVPQFRPLAPVQWEKAALDLGQDGPESLDELEESLLAKLEETRDAALEQAAESGNSLKGIFCRLTLGGASALDKALRRPGALEDLADRLRRALAELSESGGPGLWLKDLVLRTGAGAGRGESPPRQGLAGEVALQAALALEDPLVLEELAESSLQPLFGNARLRRILESPEAAETAELVAAARDLCCSLLEGE